MSVIILDYDDKRFKKLITKVEFCDIMKPSDVAHSFETDIISVCVINLSKLEEEDIEDNDKEWLQFIRNYEELKVMEIKNKKIVKALELVKEFKADPKVRLEMEMEFVNNIDVMSREMYVKEEGKIEGKKEGKKKQL